MLIHSARSLRFLAISLSDPFTNIATKAPNRGRIIIEDKIGNEFKI